MRSRLVLLLGGAGLAALAACLNPQPLPPEEEGTPTAATSSSGGSGGFNGSTGGSSGKGDDGEIVPPSPLSEAGAEPDGGDASTDANSDGGITDASDGG